MRGQKKQLAIDVPTTLIYRLQKKWKKNKLTATIFIDVKEALDYFLKEQLMIRIIELGIDNNRSFGRALSWQTEKYSWLLMDTIIKKEK